MSFRYPAGLITAGSPVAPQFPSGVWTNQQTMPYINGQVWANDPYFQNTTLLLHGDGANGTNNAQLSAFVDNSTNNFPITVNGDAYADNFSPFSLANGYWSNFFDGSGDYLSVSDNVALRFGTGDFAIEFWFNGVIGTTSQFVVSKYSTYTSDMAYVVGILRNNHPSNPRGLQVWIGNTSYEAGSGSIQDNTWYHIAVTRESGSVRLFVNGSQVGTTQTITNDITNTATLRIGASNENDSYTLGSVSNVRLVKGTAVYTSNFTPPTTPLTAISGTSLLTCQSNRFVDNSSNNFAITRNGDVTVSTFTPFTVTPNTTDGSGYFDGTGDYLQLGGQSEFAFGTGDFTIEGWFYVNAFTNTYNSLYDSRPASTNGAYVHIAIENNGKIYLFVNSGLVIQSSTGAISTGQWYHFAVARSGTSNKMFVNGVQVGSTYTDTVNYLNGASRPVIATTENVGTSVLNGYISNFRVVKGTAVYTSAFTPPTAPLTAVSGTVLLTCQYQGNVNNNGFVDSGPYDFRITRNGNTTQGSFSPFSKPAGAWGNYFDGNGDYLSFAASAQFLPGVNTDFNFEAWVYLTVTPDATNSQVVGTGEYGTSSDWVIGINSSLVPFFYINTSPGTTLTSSTAISTNTWNHIAVSRSGTASNNVKLFLNGVVVAQASTNVTLDYNGNNLTIGADENGDESNLSGYVSNVRLVNGSAVYTAAFTPPTSPLTAVTNTVLLTCQSNRFVDNSTNNFAITRNGDVRVTPFSPFPSTTAYSPYVNGGSGYFDGSGDYLVAATGSAGAPGTGDFCAEAWIYPQNSTEMYIINNLVSSGGGDTQWAIAINTGSNYIRFQGWFTAYLSGSAPPLNAWSHVAACRSGTTLSLFLNGTRIATATNSNNFSSTNDIRVGAYASGTNPFLGYIANARFVKGSSVYDPTQTTITVPTAPLTAVSGTSLLTSFTNAGIIDNTGFNNLETVGNSRIATNIEKYGTGSMYFDGTGDFLVRRFNSGIDYFGTEDFTIECWINIPNVSGNKSIIAYRNDTSSEYSFSISVNNNKLSVAMTTTAGTWVLVSDSTQTISANTWTHVAVVRFGSNIYTFVNGIRDTLSSSYTGINYVTPNTPVYIGVNGQAGSYVYYFTGYIDDLRITKGVARYTANFTPPIARFPNQ